MGEVVNLDDARAAKQAKRHRAVVAAALVALALTFLLSRQAMSAEAATPSSRYVIGQTDAAAVAPLFSAPINDEMRDAGAPWAYTPLKGGGEVPTAYRGFAVSRGGQVERAFRVWDVTTDDHPEYSNGAGTGTLLGTFSADELVARFGGDPDAVSDGGEVVQLPGGKYSAAAAWFPKPAAESLSTTDRLVGAGVQAAFVAAISWVSGGWGAIAYALASAADPGGAPMGTSPRATPTKELAELHRRAAAGEVEAQAPVLARTSSSSAPARTWLAKHAGDTPFLRWLSGRLHG